VWRIFTFVLVLLLVRIDFYGFLGWRGLWDGDIKLGGTLYDSPLE